KLFAVSIISLILANCAKVEESYYSQYITTLKVHEQQVRNGDYELFKREEVPLTDEEKAKILSDSEAIQKTLQAFNTKEGQWYLKNKHNKDLQDQLSIKRYVEHYYKITEISKNPIVNVYSEASVDYNNEKVYGFKHLRTIRFDCHSDNDVNLSEMELRKDGTLIVTHEYNLHGGAMVNGTVLFPDERIKKIEHYYSKKQADGYKFYFDEIKEKSCR
ncbi:TPA: hypothetical protein QB597_002228, partial [Pasteurella multocida]|nr:hypothetical protein [Pasteurella multocida]